MMMNPEAARRVLGINAAASLMRESIQSAYRKMVREKHPDLHPGSRINMAQFNDARDALFREVERREREDALVLAAKIRAKYAALKEGIGHVLKHAIEVGQLLTQVKARLKHGDFTPFVRKQCQIPLRTAQHYMGLAEMWAKVAARDKDATFARLTERTLRAMAGRERKKDGPAADSQSYAEEQRKAEQRTAGSSSEPDTTEHATKRRSAWADGCADATIGSLKECLDRLISRKNDGYKYTEQQIDRLVDASTRLSALLVSVGAVEQMAS